MQRRFLRKRGAVGRSAFSAGQNAIACYLWPCLQEIHSGKIRRVSCIANYNGFTLSIPSTTQAHTRLLRCNKKAIVFAFLHQRWLRIGAADEARTRYLHLGKVALYQMSYGRISGAFIPAPSRFLTGPPQKFAKQSFAGKRRKSGVHRAVLLARLHDEQQDFRRGASDRNRTNDTGIFSPLLYRLSYRGKYDPDRARTDDPQRDRLVL